MVYIKSKTGKVIMGAKTKEEAEKSIQTLMELNKGQTYLISETNKTAKETK